MSVPAAPSSPITTHVLDTAKGRPAAGVPVALYRLDERGAWEELGIGTTDADGRCRTLMPEVPLPAGTYRLVFDTGAYHGPAAFYPEVAVVFVGERGGHYHVPLLLSPFGYSTYRGS